MNRRLEPILMAISAGVFIGSTIAMLRGLEPFATWYYSFAWWSYILFVDAWLIRRGEPATVLANPDAPRLITLSITIWAGFELYNFRLHNWHYLDVPSETPIRWLGYGVAYATVLPGIFVTWRGLQVLLPARSRNGIRLRSGLPSALLWGGLISSILPWVWPRYFFPLVWLGPTAFFSAINHRLGGKGILRDVETHGPSRLYRLLGAGAICGFLWEIWNFWARSKWVYDIPFFQRLHLFEMPLAGFLGFPPFAVECHEMYRFGAEVLDRLQKRPFLQRLAWLVLMVFIAAVFAGIDVFTVRTFR